MLNTNFVLINFNTGMTIYVVVFKIGKQINEISNESNDRINL